MPFTIDHIHLRSPNPEAAAAFYVDKLGASITGRTHPGGALRVILNLGGLVTFIEEVPADTATTPPAPFVGIEHIGLRVADLDATFATLRAKGVVFTVEPRSPAPGVKIAFLNGPDNVRIELLERA